jgi:hypothetical protein
MSQEVIECKGQREDKGYCTTCCKETESLHKCPDCGLFVFRALGTGPALTEELRKGRAKIRKHYVQPIREKVNESYRLALKKARKEKNHELCIQLLDARKRELAELVKEKQPVIRAHIKKYLSPGK